jgi:hypothetical protein
MVTYLSLREKILSSRIAPARYDCGRLHFRLFDYTSITHRTATIEPPQD